MMKREELTKGRMMYLVPRNIDMVEELMLVEEPKELNSFQIGIVLYSEDYGTSNIELNLNSKGEYSALFDNVFLDRNKAYEYAIKCCDKRISDIQDLKNELKEKLQEV